jgi:hypothetical protein
MVTSPLSEKFLSGTKTINNQSAFSLPPHTCLTLLTFPYLPFITYPPLPTNLSTYLSPYLHSFPYLPSSPYLPLSTYFPLPLHISSITHSVSLCHSLTLSVILSYTHSHKNFTCPSLSLYHLLMLPYSLPHSHSLSIILSLSLYINCAFT